MDGPDKPRLIDCDVSGPKRDYVGYGRHMPRVRWPHESRIALSIVVNYEEGAEYSYPAGDGRSETNMGELAWGLEPGVRDLAIESVYEYGSRSGIWRLQRLLDDHGVPVTFYACAVALERNPQVAEWIREAHRAGAPKGGAPLVAEAGRDPDPALGRSAPAPMRCAQGRRR